MKTLKRFKNMKFISLVLSLLLVLMMIAPIETVAAQLNITPRRLRTQLSEANTSFQQILSDYRCRLAKKLLANTNESVERIVYLTGFSEPSTFYRAFKRWTNETPVEYRKRKQR